MQFPNLPKYVPSGIGAAVVALFSFSVVAHATITIADFNDITGTVNGKGGGTGWVSNWSGSNGGTIVAGDLTSSLYNAQQIGTPQHLRNVNATGLRQNYRNPAALSGTIWFSYLMMAEATGDRAGLSLNPPTATPFSDPGSAYAYLVGTTLQFQFGIAPAETLSNAVSLGSTALVVGRIELNGGLAGADPVSLWLNPDLIANADINAYTPFHTSDSVDWLSSITTIGAIAARADGASTGGGNVDNIRFSDGGGNAAQAYADVTGVPEPSTAGLLGLAATAIALRRRTRR